jgi:hypothetical protein
VFAVLGALGALAGTAPATLDSLQAQDIGIDAAPSVSPAGNLPEIVGHAQQAMIQLERAGNLFIKSCMSEAGFEYHGPTDTNVDVLVSEIQVGALTPAIARQQGYGIYQVVAEGGDPAEDPMSSGQSYLSSLSADEVARYFEALEGEGDQGAVATESGMSVVVDGCIGEARRNLLGDQLIEVFNTFTLVQFLQTDPWGDPKVVEAVDVWSECMLAAGYEFDHPNDAVGHGLQMHHRSGIATQEEIDLSTADAECRIAASLSPLVEQTAARLDREAVESSQSLLTAWADLEQLVRARVGEAQEAASAQEN